MSDREHDAIYQFVLDRAGDYTGEPPHEIEDRFLYRDLRIEGWDFADLCDELERKYRIDLKPFFEDGQPMKGWLLWKHKVARDVKVRDLADHIVSLATHRMSANSPISPKPDSF